MRCFVISPIGAPGTDIREHADDVFEYIIAPACERAGIKAERADHDTRPGVITEQMYDAILGHDLLIAVLSFHNPNVFYEIAIAEAAARPLILMIQQGDAIPFDIKDRRVLTYDLRPRALFDKIHQDALHRAILDTRAASLQGERHVPFRPTLSPLAQPSLLALDRTASFDPDERTRMVRSARHVVDMRAWAMFNLPKADDVHQAMTEASRRGVSVRVLLMDPANPALTHQIKQPEDAPMLRDYIRSGIREWTRALEGVGELRLQTRGFMSGMLQLTDEKAVITQYGLDSQTADSPAVVAPRDHPLYRAARDEFEFVWRNASKPIGEPRRTPSASAKKGSSRAKAKSSSSSPRAAGRRPRA